MLAKVHLLTYWSRISRSVRGATIVTIPALCLLVTLGTWLWAGSASAEMSTSIDGHQKRIAEKKLPIGRSNLQQSIGDERQKLAQLELIRSRINSIQKLMAEVQTVYSTSARSQLLKQSKQEIDALRREIDTAQSIDRLSLARQLSDLNDLQSVIQSLQQLLMAIAIISTLGGIYLVQLFAQELRRREAQIQTCNSTIDTLTNDIIDGIAILDRSGQIETINPALIGMFGYTAVDLLKCPLMRLFAPAIAPKSPPLPPLVTWLEQQPKLGRIWQLTAYRLDGTTFPIELSLNENPGANQTIAFVRDVSEQANLTKQLQTHLQSVEKLNLALIKTNFTLNSRNQELAEFAYATAHDLKTPIRGISTLSEWIEEEVRPYSSAQLDLHLQLLRQRTYRLNNLINGLWEYSNLGQTPVIPEPVELAIFLQEIKNEFVLPSNFKIEIHPTDLHLITCKSHLRKTIEELLNNALKHHDASIEAVSPHKHSGQIGICVQSNGEQIEFIITDDGPGIELEHHQRVFRLFETLQPRDVKENTGIGLAIAKKLVDRVGGKIWLATPAAGKGLAVHFTWPQFPLL